MVVRWKRIIQMVLQLNFKFTEVKQPTSALSCADCGMDWDDPDHWLHTVDTCAYCGDDMDSFEVCETDETDYLCDRCFDR